MINNFLLSSITRVQALRAQAKRFHDDQAGLALTEYLILLGLLTAGVIAAVLIIGTQLGVAWTSWGTWFTANTNRLDAPS